MRESRNCRPVNLGDRGDGSGALLDRIEPRGLAGERVPEPHLELLVDVQVDAAERLRPSSTSARHGSLLLSGIPSGYLRATLISWSRASSIIRRRCSRESVEPGRGNKSLESGETT